MNVEILRERYPELIVYLEAEGYSAPYVANIKREILRIIEGADREGWSCYGDVYQEHTRNTKSQTSLRSRRTILGMIERFETLGQYPGERHQREPKMGGKYHLLTEEFKHIIDYHIAAEKERGKKYTTIYGGAKNAATFLYALQEKGFETLQAITEDAVLSVFVRADGKPRYSRSYKSNISAVFKACIPQDPETVKRILTYFPALRRVRNNIQYLTPEEVTALKHVLSDDYPHLSRRDKAIGILALNTGLRSCDIAGLTLESIDWERDTVLIRQQQKTNAPLELPLTAAVGNAIYDYLTMERPKTRSEYAFVTAKRPYARLQSSDLGVISGRIMDAAGIRQAYGDRRGFHIFRHRLTMALLGNGVARPVITQILGHISPDSINPYLSADFVHLKELALSVERFPVGEGVFADA